MAGKTYGTFCRLTTHLSNWSFHVYFNFRDFLIPIFFLLFPIWNLFKCEEIDKRLRHADEERELLILKKGKNQNCCPEGLQNNKKNWSKPPRPRRSYERLRDYQREKIVKRQKAKLTVTEQQKRSILRISQRPFPCLRRGESDATTLNSLPGDVKIASGPGIRKDKKAQPGQESCKLQTTQTYVSVQEKLIAKWIPFLSAGKDFNSFALHGGFDFCSHDLTKKN